MATIIGDIVETVPCISQHAKSKEVDKIFSDSPKLQGIVVTSNNIPIALITRTHFYQSIGTLYGYNLYMGRGIHLLAKQEPLIVDYKQPITEVSKLAMERKDEDLYDYVIVTKDNKLLGIVSVQKLLMQLVEIQVEVARFLNPLTGLPGNHMIAGKLNESIHQEKYSIIYFDLDNFKAYNDTYGFKKGDDLIQSTTNLLKRVFAMNDSFLGHIGGDDFLAILNNYEYELACKKIIRSFDDLIKYFYNTDHLLKQFVITENRQGMKEKIPLVSLSVAVVTNQQQQFKNVEELVEYAAVVKKKCKLVKGSCCLINAY